MKIQSKEIQLVSIDSLIPYQKNMNKHTPEQIDRLVKLIEYQGFRDPIIVQKGTNIIAAGHGRIEAARKMGIKEVPVTFQEFESEAQFYAFVVSHNAINSNNWGGGLDLGQINQDFLDLGPELDIEMLGIKEFSVEPLEKKESEEIDINFEYKLEVDCGDEITQQQTMAELIDRGLKVRVLL